MKKEDDLKQRWFDWKQVSYGPSIAFTNQSTNIEVDQPLKRGVNIKNNSESGKPGKKIKKQKKEQVLNCIQIDTSPTVGDFYQNNTSVHPFGMFAPCLEPVDIGMNPKDLIGQTKPSLSLIPGTGLVYLAKVMENGASKYGAYNWRDYKIQSMTYCDAILRHIHSYIDGEELANDSGLPHLAHLAATALILLDAIESNQVVDNRPKKGYTSQTIDKFTEKK